MKVGKEEVIGCLTAIETWLTIDSKKLYAEWNARVDRIAKLVETVPGVNTEIYIPDDGNRYPTLRVSWDQQGWGFSITDCVRKLGSAWRRMCFTFIRVVRAKRFFKLCYGIKFR